MGCLHGSAKGTAHSLDPLATCRGLSSSRMTMSRERLKRHGPASRIIRFSSALGAASPAPDPASLLEYLGLSTMRRHSLSATVCNATLPRTDPVHASAILIDPLIGQTGDMSQHSERSAMQDYIHCGAISISQPPSIMTFFEELI